MNTTRHTEWQPDRDKIMNCGFICYRAFTFKFSKYKIIKRKGCVHVKPIYAPWPFQGGASVVIYSYCQCSSAFCLFVCINFFFI